MKKLSFSISFVVSVVLNLAIKPLWVFGVDRIVQNEVGESAYGLFFTIFGIISIFNILLDFGLSHIYSREISNNEDNLVKYFKSFLNFKLILFLLYIVVVFCFLMHSHILSNNIVLIIVLVLQQFLFFIIIFLRSMISGALLLKTDAIFSVLDRLIMIICFFLIHFLFHIKITILGFSYILLFGEIITVLILIVYLYKKFQLFDTYDIETSFKKIFKKTYKLSLSILMMAIAVRVDGFLLYKLQNDNGYSVGVYAGVFRIIDFCYSFIYIITVIMIPVFTKQKINLKKLRFYYFSSTIILGTLIFIFAMVVQIKSSLILELMYHKNIPLQIQTLQIIIFGLIGIWVQNVYYALMIAFDKINYYLIVSLIGAVVSIVLNIVFIPKYNYLASAYINLGLSIGMAIGMMLLFENFIRKKIAIQ